MGAGGRVLARLVPDALKWGIRKPNFRGSWNRTTCPSSRSSGVVRSWTRHTASTTSRLNRQPLGHRSGRAGRWPAAPDESRHSGCLASEAGPTIIASWQRKPFQPGFRDRSRPLVHLWNPVPESSSPALVWSARSGLERPRIGMLCARSAAESCHSSRKRRVACGWRLAARYGTSTARTT